MSITRRLFLVAAVIAAAVMAVRWHYRDLPFEEAKWKSARTTKDARILYSMRGDLAERLRSQKPSREEVIAILGPADFSTGDILVYFLGAHHAGQLFFSDWRLTINLRQNRVSTVNIHPG